MNSKFKHPFGNILRDYKVMRRRLPAEISNIAVQEFKWNFRIGGYRTDRGVIFWKKRKNGTKGKGRAILVKSGRLKRGIQKAPTYDYARVINAVLYANANNEGFKGTVTVRSYSRNRYSKSKGGTGVYSVKTKKERTRSVKSVSRKVQVRSHKRKMNLPARPFMITTQPLLNNIEKHVFTKLEQIWKKA